MLKKGILVFRILLYSFAAFIVYDMFFSDTNENIKRNFDLVALTKNESTVYYEFFLKKNEADSMWYALQTMPSLGRELKINAEGPWNAEGRFFSQFEERGYEFVGFYISQTLALNAESFYKIRENITELTSHPDARLKALNPNKEFTAIFLKAN